MGKTINLGLPYPESTTLDNVPKHLKELADPIDANLQLLSDGLKTANAEIDTAQGTADNATQIANSNASTLAQLDAQYKAGDKAVRDYVDQVAFSDFGGRSAYEIAVANGYAGTEQDWLKTLIGARGPAGPYGGTEITDPQMKSLVSDDTTQTKTYLDSAYVRRSFTRSADQNGNYINLTDLSADASGASMIRLTDDPANSGSILSLYHKGASGAQAYGINIANMPGSKNAFTIHQYSKQTPAVQIDNTDGNVGIYIKNTENQTMNPGGTGNGSFLSFLPYGETGGLQLTNGLTWLNNSTKDIKIQAVRPSIYAFGIQVDADKTGLQVTKTATGAGNAAWISNAGTGNALFVSQTGNAEAMQVYSDVADRVASRVRGNNYGLAVGTVADGGDTVSISKSGTGVGAALRITNKGVGSTVSFMDGNGEVAKIYNNGEIELYTPGAGIIMRSPDGGRYKVYVNNLGALVAAKSA